MQKGGRKNSINQIKSDGWTPLWKFLVWSFSLPYDIWPRVALKGPINIIWCLLGRVPYTLYDLTAERSGREASCLHLGGHLLQNYTVTVSLLWHGAAQEGY